MSLESSTSWCASAAKASSSKKTSAKTAEKPAAKKAAKAPAGAGPELRLRDRYHAEVRDSLSKEFGYETVELLRDSEFRFALFSVAANVIVGIGAVYLGRMAVSLTT